MANCKHSPETKARVIAMAREGLRNTDISHVTGIPLGTVTTWTKGNHLKSKKVESSRKVIFANGHQWVSLTGWDRWE